MLNWQHKVKIGGVAFDVKLTLVIIMSVVLPMLLRYGHGPCNHRAYDQLVLFFAVPMAVILFVFWEDPRNYGFRIGKWREGLAWTLGGCLGMAVIITIVTKLSSDMGVFYDAKGRETVGHIVWIWGVEMFAWEFIWRGMYLFALARVLGAGPAIFLQAVPFAYLHMGKPEVEALSTIFGGACFGFVAWRSQSFLYAFLIHWFMVVFIILLSSGYLF